MPGDLSKVFFTLSGAEANEAAIRIARMVTGRHKILARYRSYHGSTSGAITLTGDPRRWPNEPGIPGVVHILDPWHGPGREPDTADEALAYVEEVVELEGPRTIAAIVLEPVSGTNGVLIPPDGYLQGVRELCSRFGILFVADEVMSGFGRTGRWFAVDHWGVVPDLMTMGKGLSSSYLPLGAVGVSSAIADQLESQVLYAGLTHNSHPLCCAAALAVIEAYEQDGLIERAARMGHLMAKEHDALRSAHPIVSTSRSIGLFGMLELENPANHQPLAPFNGSSAVMRAFADELRDRGLFTIVRWNMVMTNPPLVITEAELREGFQVLDEALTHIEKAWADRGYVDETDRL
jgi:taurine--2-oxoglutarate transaminase